MSVQFHVDVVEDEIVPGTAICVSGPRESPPITGCRRVVMEVELPTDILTVSEFTARVRVVPAYRPVSGDERTVIFVMRATG